MRAFINREDVDFEVAHQAQPLQEWQLAENSQQGKLEYSTKYSKFMSVSSLTLHFPQNYGSSNTVIYYIGLKGERTGITTRQVILNSVYELKPNVKDHKLPEESKGAFSYD